MRLSHAANALACALGLAGGTSAFAYNGEELAAWTMLVNELMNLDEVLNK